MVRKNLVANLIGQIFQSILAIALIPIYIEYLGIESYGLIGVFITLQACLSLLDLGITPALGREMSLFTGNARSRRSLLDLLRSVEILAVALAIIMVLSAIIISNYIALKWLKSEGLEVSTVANSLKIMGAVASLRFIEGVYKSSIYGLQQQVWVNIVNTIIGILRSFGAILVLMYISKTIEAFFVWHGLISILTLILYYLKTYRLIGEKNYTGKWSISALISIRGFASGMIGITIIGLLLTQVDKIILTKILSLTNFGYYTLAGTVSNSLYMLIGPIAQAIYPRLCELNALQMKEEFCNVYHKGAQLVSIIAGAAAIVIIIYSEKILILWTANSKLSESVAPIVSFLTIANIINGIYWIPYQAQLAVGWTNLTLKLGATAVIIMVPIMIMATYHWGILGATSSLIFTQISYVSFGIYIMHKKILKDQLYDWMIIDIIHPLGACIIFVLLYKMLLLYSEIKLNSYLELTLVSFGAIFTAFIFAKDVRAIAIEMVLKKLK